MKFSRILGVCAAVLVTTAVAQQAATTTTPAPAAPEAAVPASPAVAGATVTNPPVAAPAVAAVDAKPATWGDAKAGQTKAGACAACHGVDGNSSDPQYPKLAGQHEQYVARQLKLFKSGERVSPIMQPMAAPLSEQDMRDIGAYFATQAAAAGVSDDTPVTSGPNAGKAYYQIGERIFRGGNPVSGVPACQACHGPAGRGIPGPTYPSIGAQHAGYAATQLKFFRDGGQWGADSQSKVMSTVAKNLTDEEIQGLATYLEGLHAATAPKKATP